MQDKKQNMKQKQRKYCSGCGQRLTRDNCRTFYNGETGEPYLVYDLVCPNYEKEYSLWDAIRNKIKVHTKEWNQRD